MKNYDKSKESSYLMYLDANKLYMWGMSQKLPANGFKWKTNMSIFDEEFIRNYDEDDGMHDLHSDLPCFIRKDEN